MGHKNKKSLIRQVQEKLVGKLAAGESRHLGKAAGIADTKVYSYGTLDAYLQQCCDFVKFAKAEHQAKTLEDFFGAGVVIFGNVILQGSDKFLCGL